MAKCSISIEVEGRNKEIDKFYSDFKRKIRPKKERFEFPFEYERNNEFLYLHFDNESRDCENLVSDLEQISSYNKFIVIKCWTTETHSKNFSYLFAIKNGSVELTDRTKEWQELRYGKKQIEGIL